MDAFFGKQPAAPQMPARGAVAGERLQHQNTLRSLNGDVVQDHARTVCRSCACACGAVTATPPSMCMSGDMTQKTLLLRPVTHQTPGIKADMARAKQALTADGTVDKRDPRGVGTAWWG